MTIRPTGPDTFKWEADHFSLNADLVMLGILVETRVKGARVTYQQNGVAVAGEMFSSTIHPGDHFALAQSDVIVTGADGAPAPAGKQLPERIGAVISWRGDNDAGTDIASFAERVDATTWRVNGFDLESENLLLLLLGVGDSCWAELTPRSHETRGCRACTCQAATTVAENQGAEMTIAAPIEPIVEDATVLTSPAAVTGLPAGTVIRGGDRRVHTLDYLDGEPLLFRDDAEFPDAPEEVAFPALVVS